MLRNNPGHVKDRVNEAQRCWAEWSIPINAFQKAGWKSRRSWNPTAPQKRWVPHGDCALRLWNIPQKSWKRDEEGCSYSPLESAFQEREERHITILRILRKRKKKRRTRKRLQCLLRRNLKQRGSCRGAVWPASHAPLSGCWRRMESPRSRSWKPQNSGAEVLSIRRTRREEIFLTLKKGGDVSAFKKELHRAVGERADVKSLISKRTSTKPSQGKRLLTRCASRWASQTSGTSAGCTRASTVCRLRWPL